MIRNRFFVGFCEHGNSFYKNIQSVTEYNIKMIRTLTVTECKSVE